MWTCRTCPGDSCQRKWDTGCKPLGLTRETLATGDSVSRMDLPIGPPMHRLSLDARAEAEGGNRW